MASGSKQVIATDIPVREQFYVNPDSATATLGSTHTWRYIPNKKGKYPVLEDLKIRFKCKNSSSNDTWDIESLWHLIETMKIRLNGKECLEIKDNLTREIFNLRKLHKKSKEAVQQREYVLTRGAGTGVHNSTTIAVSTTSSYYHASLNDVCDIFHDLRLCPINSIEIEITFVNGTATTLLDYVSYDNSTGSEALSTYWSLTNMDLMLEISFYNTPQTAVSEYIIPTTKYDKRDFSTTFTSSANGSYTIDLDDWHNIQSISDVHIYGRDASADGCHKQYLGLGWLSKIDWKRAGKVEYQWLNQYHLIEAILERRRAHIGADHWLLPNDSWVTGEEVLFISVPLVGRNRHYGEGVHVREGMANKCVKHELILYNESLTDANMTRLSVILESKHYVKINRTNGVVSVA